MDYFQHHEQITIALMVLNNPKAKAAERARKYLVPVLFYNKLQWAESQAIADELLDTGIDYIVLAGFLWQIPMPIVKAFEDRILNIHPALLPYYGGKGMYGHHVHQAVLQSKETSSGMTIHLVNEEYDKGRVLLQATCEVKAEDSPSTLAERVLHLEHRYYKLVVEDYILNH